jgi:pyruvate dehydrogenase E1 component alpha subunit/2-oxoisovalerate dehydrogenase E1 component alpha subunit
MEYETFCVLDDSQGAKHESLDLSPDDLRTMYQAMALSRALDLKFLGLQRQGRIGFYGESRGEEASVIGSAYALEPRDWIFPALRQGAAALLRGFPLDKWMAQLLGSSEDILKGHQMPCHISDRSVNHVAWSSCIGTQLPHAVGAAMAAKYRGDPVVAMAYLGDGATSESDFHAAMNFAGVYRAPVVFVCQNNQWAISVPVTTQTASETIAQKAKAYGLRGVRVDGNDVLAVYARCKEAVDLAREEHRATLVECVTYRIGAHSSSDDTRKYRSKEEEERWAARDPIMRFRRYLEKEGLWDEAEEAELRAELKGLIDDTLRRAEAVPTVGPESLFEDIYAEAPWNLVEQMGDLKD